MKTLLRWSARLYPARWRERYGEEFAALLEDLRPRWRDVVDVVKGGLMARLFNQRGFWTVAGCGLLGAALALAVTFLLPVKFRANAVFTAPSQSDSGAARTLGRRFELATSRLAVADVIRKDVRLVAQSSGVYAISFTYPEAEKASAVALRILRDMAPGMVSAEQRPTLPVTPNRPIYALAGFAGGMLLGAFASIRRRPASA